MSLTAELIFAIAITAAILVLFNRTEAQATIGANIVLAVLTFLVSMIAVGGLVSDALWPIVSHFLQAGFRKAITQ
jgi:hypothetical protein